MKKLLIILVMFFAVSTSKAQNQIFYGVAVEYQSTTIGSDWPDWVDCESPILLYVDLGFGFIAIENGYKDRFIVNELKETYEGEDKLVLTLTCVDRSRKPATVMFTVFAAGNLVISIYYTDVKYAYKVQSDDGDTGYPFEYFKNKPKQNTGKFDIALL